MIICTTKNGVEAIPKSHIRKISSGEKFVAVHIIKWEENAVMIANHQPKTTIRRFLNVIIDGIKIIPNEEGKRLEEEKENLFELKDEINACRKDIDEMQKNINKNDCVIKRLFSRKKD